MKPSQSLALASALALGSVITASAQSSFSSSANPYRSASGLGGGLHFSSPAAAYMNTMFMRGSDKAQVEAVKRESAARRARQAAAGQAPMLANNSFALVPGEQVAVLDNLVGGVPAGPSRAQLRRRLQAVSEQVEGTPGWQRGNLAMATYTLAGLSFTKATGRSLDPSLASELVHGIDEAYAHDAALQAMSGRERSRIYYLYTATIGLTLQLSLSKDPAEVAQGRALALSSLHELGIKH
jgi:hypothetical protein